jgi:tetratricopeptide (TPR) repeat protein
MRSSERPTESNFARWLSACEESMRQGRYEDALTAPELASHLGPKERARAWALRAIACYSRGMPEEADNAWSFAFTLCVDDSWILMRFVVWQLDQGQLTGGLVTAIGAVELAGDEDRADARYVRGQAFWFCGRKRAALADFLAAAEASPLGSETQLCALLSLTVVMAGSADAPPETVAAVLELASRLRDAPATRDHPRLQGVIFWVGGLAQCLLGRERSGTRDLQRAIETFLGLGDIATAALATLDYATVTGKPLQPLLADLRDDAPAGTDPEILDGISALASGRLDTSGKEQLMSLVVKSMLQNRAGTRSGVLQD